MTESAVVFNQTNAERAKIGRSAHHKANGSSVAKLGNTPLTNKEIASKHGPVQTYPEGFTSYDEFKKMPADLEAEYVNRLCSKYAIRMEHISEFLFEAGPTDLMARLKILGVYKNCPQLKTTAVMDSAVEKFKSDVSEWREREATAEIIDLSEAKRKRDIIENAEFISYEEYKSFSDTEKLDYINHLVDRYDVGRNVIAKVLFGKSVGTLDAYFKTKNLSSSLHTAKSHVVSERQAKTKAFEHIVKVWKGEASVEEKTEPIKEKSASVARDILSAIIGKEIAEEPEKLVIGESTTSAEEKPIEENNPETAAVEVKEHKDDSVAASIPTADTNPHTTVFSANYKSVGMDCNELDALKLMLMNKPVEVCITVRTI